jgi:hypothetical protein
MSKAVAVAFYGITLASHLVAQLDFLTYREAEAVIEHVPDVAAARNAGGCPIQSGTYEGMEDLIFRVRYGCGSWRGQLIGVYDVNRRTGDVATWGDNPSPIEDRQLRQFSNNLISQVQQRRLSMDEANCLALEAGRDLCAFCSQLPSVSVPTNSPRYRSVRFTIGCRSSTYPIQCARTLTVNLGTARVRDDETGQDLISERLGAVTSKMINLRFQHSLTDTDALLIALRVPVFMADVGPGCGLYTAGPFRPREIEVAVECGGKQKAGARALIVNTDTGQTSEAETGDPLESQESVQLARQILHEKEQMRLTLRKEIVGACETTR